MNGSVYYYFQSIYGNSNEPIICIDENLNIIFATSAAYDVFGLKKSPILHLNCVFMRKYLKPLKNAFDKGECFTINFESVNDSSHKKCILMPVFHDKEKYAVLIFTDISSEEIDNLRKYELKRGIAVIESSIINSTSIIVSHMRLIQENRPNEKSINIILQNVMIIRRLFRNLNLLAAPNLKSKFSQVIDINEYLRYIVNIIASQIGNDKIDFNLALCSELLIAEIEPKIFEILICNLVSNSVKNSFGKTKITVQSVLRDQQILVVFSDNGIGCRQIDKLFSSPNRYFDNGTSEFSGIGVSIIRKIVTDHGGQIFATENRGGGVSVGFTLPKADKRKSVLHSPMEFEPDNDEIFSTINVEIAEFIDVDNFSL